MNKKLDIDINSLEWAEIKNYLESRLVRLREDNDGNLQPIETANVRGRISEIKNFLKSVEKEKHVEIKKASTIRYDYGDWHNYKGRIILNK